MSGATSAFAVLRRALGRAPAALPAAIACAVLAAPASAEVPGHGRAWELASAGAGNGVLLAGASAWTADGDGVAFTSMGPLPGGRSGELTATTIAARTSGGWTRRRVGVPFDAHTTQLLARRVVAVSGDLSTWVWSSTGAWDPQQPDGPATDLFRIAADDSVTPLAGMGTGYAFVSWASEDARHVAFEATSRLLPADAGRDSGRAAYELAGTELRLVGVDDAGVPVSPCGSGVGDGSGDPLRAPNAMSRDGSRIWFTSPAPGSSACPQPSRLYLRVDGARTIEASASRCSRADCGPPAAVRFAGATADGAHAFMTTAQQLTDDDVDASTDLYRYTVRSGELVRLSAGPAGTAAGVDETAIVLSGDGERVYFSATGALVPGAGAPGPRSIYRWHRGSLRRVGTLDGADLTRASASDDGRVLLFLTRARLAATDVDDRLDAYRYDESAGLEHISRGEPGRGDGAFDVTTRTTANWVVMAGQAPRALSADGSRAFFVTAEALTADDVNERDDVYEWHRGTLGLVTSGAPGGRRLSFEGVSANGATVFFVSDESLTADDGDNGDPDLYGARLGGGFAAPAPQPRCDGDACQGELPRHDDRMALDSASAPEEGNHVLRRTARRLALLPIPASARRRLARTGSAVVKVRVDAAGRVEVTGTARLRGQRRLVARGTATVARPSTARVRLRLRPLARRHLARRGATLRIALVARRQGLRDASTATVTLKGRAR